MNKKLLIYIILVIFCNTMYAQNVISSCKFKIPLFSKTSLIIEPEYIFKKNNYTYENEYGLKSDIRFKISKNIQINIGTKISSEIDLYETNFVDDDNNVHFDFNYKIPIKKTDFEINFRYRLQTDFEKTYNRNRIEIIQTDFDIIQPFVSVETFSNLKLNAFIKSKLRFGIEHELNKKISFQEYFEIGTKIKNTLPDSQYNLGFTINIDL